MKQIKRFLSAVLALALMLGVMAMPASAISLNTKMVIDPVYEDAERFVEGYAAVKLNGKWGYINDNGEMVVEAKYDWAGIHMGGYAVVAKKGNAMTLSGIIEEVYLICLIDMQGKEIPLDSPYVDEATGRTIPLYFYSVSEIEDSNSGYWQYTDGVVNAGWYPYNTKGEMIVPKNPEVLYQEGNYNYYYMMDNCIGGVIPMYAECLEEAGTYQFFYMDVEGNITRTFPVSGLEDVQYSYVSAPNDGLILVGAYVYDEATNQWPYYYGVQNEAGEWVMPLEYDVIQSFVGGTFTGDGVIVASKNGKYGMFNTKGEAITAMEYDALNPFIRGRAWGYKDMQNYILDPEGNAYAIADLNGIVQSDAYTVTAYSDTGVAAVYDYTTGSSFCISKKPEDGIIHAVKGSEELGTSAYFVDVNGDGVIEKTSPPSELIAVYRDGKWGYALLDVEHDNPFNDLKEGKFYVDAVLWAVYENITTGVTATEFQPDKACTRSQIVTFIWRAMGCPEPESTVNPFTDVKEDAYYYKAVLWAVENGITTGKTATTFAPKEACTRNQAVTFLWRAAGEPEPESTAHTFADVSDNAYYADAVLWAVENGITNGVNETTFAPKQECTRGHIVTFLYRNLVG